MTSAPARPRSCKGFRLRGRWSVARGYLIATLPALLGACFQSRTCIPGLDVHRAYPVSVLGPSVAPRVSTARLSTLQTCGALGDLAAGSIFVINVVDQQRAFSAIDCDQHVGSASRLANARFDKVIARLSYARFLDDGSQFLIETGNEVDLGGGCRGEWFLLLVVVDKGDPFRAPKPGQPSPVQAARIFEPSEVAPCLRSGSNFGPVPKASDALNGRNICADWFDVRIDRK